MKTLNEQQRVCGSHFRHRHDGTKCSQWRGTQGAYRYGSVTLSMAGFAILERKFLGLSSEGQQVSARAYCPRYKCCESVARRANSELCRLLANAETGVNAAL